METETATIAAYVVAATLITITPGLDTMLILRTAAVEGARRAAAAGLGILVGCLIWGTAVAIGVGAIVSMSAMLYDGLRVAGACYLGYLGISLLRRPRRQAADLEASPTSGSTWFSRGLVTNLLNPKVGVFYLTFLPPFVPAHADVVPFTMLLALIHCLLGAIWFALLISGARKVSTAIMRPGVLAWLDRLTGLALLGIGLKLIFSPYSRAV